MSNHSEVSVGARHPIHDFEFADTAAREAAAGLDSGDVGKVAKQIDDNTYWLLQDTSPTWVEVTSQGGGGGGFSFYLPDSDAPNEGEVGGYRVFDFSNIPVDPQKIFAKISVPPTYKAGKQIKLKGGKYATVPTSGNVFFRATTSLIESGSTVLGTFSNQHASTNVEKTVQGVASTFDEIGDMDLTDADGLINGQAVNPGDELLIELTRDVPSESSTAADDARLGRDSFAPTFS